MKSFRTFLNEQESVQQNTPVNPIPSTPIAPAQYSPEMTASGEKKQWSASKKDILNYWKAIQANNPLLIKPIPYEHKGSTYGEDGIRITGSPQFITSVISHLKDFLAFETQQTKLAVSYRETASPSKLAAGQNKKSFVFYIAVKERGAKG
jgi:hypothetical protein